MTNLFGTLRLASSALRVQSQALSITSQNLANMGTPGYAKQVANFTDTVGGGVRLGPSINTRSDYAEQTVRSEQSLAGESEAFGQLAQGVSAVLGLDDVTGNTGLGAAMKQLFASFTNWATNPGSPIDAQSVITSARQVAASFAEVGQFLEQQRDAAQTTYLADVAQVNHLVSDAQKISAQMGAQQPPDAVLDAQLHGKLEELSSYVPIVSNRTEKGRLEISINGSVPLLSGDRQFLLSGRLESPAADAPFPQGAPALRLFDSEGNDITGSITAGKLNGEIKFTNDFLPSLIGNGQQQGDLNRLAQGLADSVNRRLGSSAHLFEYEPGNSDTAAATLRVNSDLTSSDLLQLQTSGGSTLASGLATIPGGKDPQDQLDGAGYQDYFGSMQRATAAELVTKQTSLDLHTRLRNQADSLRNQIQGVSLEEEAVNLLAFQRGFDAMAKVIGVINEMTQTAINLFH